LLGIKILILDSLRGCLQQPRLLNQRRQAFNNQAQFWVLFFKKFPKSHLKASALVSKIAQWGVPHGINLILDLSLFLFFRFTLLNWAILCKMGLISAVLSSLFYLK
jgi:hypothetical protein